MIGDLRLDSLLNALRTAGLCVGVSEVLRLRHVFASQPALADGDPSRERLKSVLRAVLVKSAEDRAIFDRVCDAWLERSDRELGLRQLRSHTGLIPPLEIDFETEVGRRVSHTQWRAVAVALMILLVVVIVDLRMLERGSGKPEVAMPQTAPKPTGTGQTTSSPAGKPKAPNSPATPLKETTSFWRFLPWPEISFAALAWIGAGGLWLALRHRRLIPEPEPFPHIEGPLRTFIRPEVSAGTVLLSPGEQEGLAWGIGRFVSEEPTRRLDLAATVRATALAGGVPALRFQHARFFREVWLWVDESSDDLALLRLAGEIEAVLVAHGLPVERASFRGIPDRLVTAAGQVFAPNEIDERRDSALVAVLTDGRRLARRWAVDAQRTRIEALLRSLSHWPHLAFVDASRDGDGLASIFGRHGLTVVTPEAAAAFLAGSTSPTKPLTIQGENRDGESAWAAACALCPAPVDEVTALALRRQLPLPVSPYALEALRSEAPGPPGRLVWKTTDRIRRLSWLREAEIHPDGEVAPKSLLDQALRFWEDVYDRSLEPAEDTERAETPAERFLRMERALLGLWRSPRPYAAELYQLFQGPLRDIIRQHCEILAPAGWGRPGLVQLPWPWSAPTPVERAMLREMGLGGEMPRAGLRRPGRVWLGIGLLIGLGLTAAARAAIGCRNNQVEENGFTFVHICPGTFIMGSKPGDLQADDNERPAHTVTLDEFWIGKFEVTNEQFRKIYPNLKGESNLPVVGVSWFEANKFCENFGYSLPTEAEWEYAARAGTETPWSFGSEVGKLSRFAWFEQGFDTYVRPIGLKEPNPWGLHDMHGNVWEWTRDVYAPYPADPQVNPVGPLSGPLRVLRGGSFLHPASDLRSTGRKAARPEYRYRDRGFRCVRASRH